MLSVSLLSNFPMLIMTILGLQSSQSSPDLPSPVDALRKFFSGVSANEVWWIIVGIIMIYGLYWIAIQELRRNKITWRTVLKWIAFLTGWSVFLILFGWLRIAGGGPAAVGIGFLIAGLAGYAVYRLRNRTSDWHQILSGTIILLIGATIILTIAKGAQALSYAIVFGCSFGIIVGMLCISIWRMNTGDVGPEEDDEWSNARPPGL